jgi:hypothetical protein
MEKRRNKKNRETRRKGKAVGIGKRTGKRRSMGKDKEEEK